MDPKDPDYVAKQRAILLGALAKWEKTPQGQIANQRAQWEKLPQGQNANQWDESVKRLKQRQAQYPDPGDVMRGRVEKQKEARETPGQTQRFIEGMVEGAASRTKEIITNPVDYAKNLAADTASGVKNAVTHPLETRRAILTQGLTQTPREAGKGVGKAAVDTAVVSGITAGGGVAVRGLGKLAAPSITLSSAERLALNAVKGILDCEEASVRLKAALPGGRLVRFSTDNVLHQVYRIGEKVLDTTSKQYVGSGRAWSAAALEEAGLTEAVESGVFSVEQHARFMSKVTGESVTTADYALPPR